MVNGRCSMEDYNSAYQLLLHLYDIIKVEGKGRIDYYINEVARIIATIEEYQENNDLNLLKDLDKSILNLYTGRASLDEFYIMRDNEEERIRLNKPLTLIENELWKMFS